MQSSEISSEFKKILLNNIKNQCGEDQYEKMVDMLGEDKVLNCYLASLEAQKSGKIEKEGAETLWDKYGGWVTFISLCLVVFLILFACFGLEIGLQTVFGLYTGTFASQHYYMFCDFVHEKINETLGISLGFLPNIFFVIVAIGIIVFFVWTVIPWVCDWFVWFSKHFV